MHNWRSTIGEAPELRSKELDVITTPKVYDQKQMSRPWLSWAASVILRLLLRERCVFNSHQPTNNHRLIKSRFVRESHHVYQSRRKGLRKTQCYQLCDRYSLGN